MNCEGQMLYVRNKDTISVTHYPCNDSGINSCLRDFSWSNNKQDVMVIVKKRPGWHLESKNHHAYAVAIIETFILLNIISTENKAIQIFHCGKEDDAREIDKVLETTRTTLLYDETGIYDEIACFKSYDITLEEFPNNQIFAVPNFRSPLLDNDTERLYDIINTMKCRNIRTIEEYYLSDIFGSYEYFADSPETADNHAYDLNALVKGITCGYEELNITGEELFQLKQDYYDASYDGQNGITLNGIKSLALSLIYNNEPFVQTVLNTNHFWQNFYDCIKIWQYGVAKARLPFDFKVSKFGNKERQDSTALQSFAEYTGIKAMIKAYYSGVSINDIIDQ